MAITVQIDDSIAIIDTDRWESKDETLKDLLSIFNRESLREFYTPWPDYTLAEMACKALGGKIIEATDPPEYVDGRVY